MDIEYFCNYLLAKPHTSSDTPFDEVTVVFRVAGKIFALTHLDPTNFDVNLKCDPDRVEELRERYEGVQPGYHMNKKHWNTVHFSSDVPQAVLLELIDHSYDLVYQGLPAKIRKELSND
jgi:predicted DNA-binding protein (MmcQ/YjbR family)